MIESRTKFVVAPKGTRAVALGERLLHSSEAEADTVAASLGEAVFIITVTVEEKQEA